MPIEIQFMDKTTGANVPKKEELSTKSVPSSM